MSNWPERDLLLEKLNQIKYSKIYYFSFNSKVSE